MIQVRHINVTILQGDISAYPQAHAAIAANATLFNSGVVDEHTVRHTCASVIEQAEQTGAPKLMLPAFGVDAGFPLIGCAKIMAQEVLRTGRESTLDDTLKEIEICLFSDEAFKVFDKQVYGYLRHVMEDMAWGPYVTTDIIIEVGDGIILIERTNPPFGWALPGGFVDHGESLETAACREAKEETAMDLADLKQFHIYSDPARDPRFHTVTTVFTAKGIGTPCAGDDAKGLKIVPLAELRKLSYAFDHNQVIDDYLKSRGM